jgi:hypothetical protein
MVAREARPKTQKAEMGSGCAENIEAENTRRDRKACVEVKRGVVVGHLSDDAMTRIPKVPFGGVYLTFM